MPETADHSLEANRLGVKFAEMYDDVFARRPRHDKEFADAVWLDAAFVLSWSVLSRDYGVSNEHMKACRDAWLQGFYS